MGKWTKIRWFLRAAGVGIAATAAAATGPLALILVGVGAAVNALTVDLPRDTWNDNQRKAKANTQPQP